MDEYTRSVRRVSDSAASDATHVAERVAWQIEATGRFRNHQLHVTAIEGVVTLRGRVSSFYQKQVAQAMALGVEGVMRLENEVEVT